MMRLLTSAALAFASVVPAAAQSLGNVAWGSVQAGQDAAIAAEKGKANQDGEKAQLTPAGWSVTIDGVNRQFVSPDKRGQIMLMYFNDDPAKDLNDLAKKGLQSGIITTCPKDLPVTVEQLAGGAVQASMRGTAIDCSMIAGRNAGSIALIVAYGADARIGAKDKAKAIASKIFGNAKSGKAIAAAKVPVAKPGLGSKPVTGHHGVWVNLGMQTVYDPVMSIRMEYGTNYLVLTESGFFANELPHNGAFNDEGMRAIIRDDKHAGGRYIISGNKITLNYASGKVETATQSKSGNSWIIALDDAEYSPKRIFPDGATLSGAYTNSSVTRTGVDSFVTGDHDLTFSTDGRFVKGGNVSIAGGSFTIIGGDNRGSGTYYIKDSALHLTYADGTKEIMSMWQETPNDAIWFNGNMYKVAGDE